MPHTPTDTAGPHFAAFMAAYCTHSKGRWAGQPVELEAWQREMVDEALELDAETGERLYQTVLFGIPRKNGKSALGSGFGLYLLTADGENGPEVVIASGSKDQADIVFDQARAYVDANEELSADLVCGKLAIRFKSDEGVLKRIAADGKLQHGLNPNGVVFDELHAVTTPRQEELWAAMTTGDGAREAPLTVIITTAGSDKDTVLGRLFDAALESPTADIEKRPGLTIVRDPDAGFLMYWYGVDDEAARELDWNDEASWMPAVLQANPASWVTAAYLRRKRNSPAVSLGTFKRLYANVWTVGKESWFEEGVWQGLKRPGLYPPDDAPLWVGVDIGLSSDSSGVAYSWRHRELDVDEDTGEILQPLEVGLSARVWSVIAGTQAHVHVPGGRFRVGIAKEYILEELVPRFPVRAVVYDPTFFAGPAEELDDLGLTIIPMVQSSAPMAQVWQDFYIAVKESAAVHDGDPIVAAHVAATAAELTDRGWRIRKLKSTQRIDAVPAMAMAHFYAARGDAPAAESPYEKRGLRIL